MDFTPNFLAVAVAAILYFLLGGIWYSPLLFGRTWMASQGWTPADAERVQQGAAPAYAVSFIGGLLAAYALAVVIQATNTVAVQGGLLRGLLVWLGFVATTNAPPYFYEDRPRKVYLIYVGYTFTGFLVMSLILSVWR